MTRIIGERYELLDPLGKGAMGIVYRGQDKVSGALVAVKILKSEITTPEQVERFKREADALTQLDHPNIVKIWDAILENGDYCIVMEYMSGGSLRDILTRDKKLPLDYTINLGLDLCDALVRTHRLQIIHRDLKPDNVLLDDAGVPHLADFGQAHVATAATLTRAGQIIGTPSYMAPEVILGDPADERSDIWSFGVMLYEAISGFRPFMAPATGALINAILQQPVPDLLKLRPECPPHLAQLVHSMLEKKHKDRIFSVRQVAAHLELALGELNAS